MKEKDKQKSKATKKMNKVLKRAKNKTNVDFIYELKKNVKRSPKSYRQT